MGQATKTVLITGAAGRIGLALRRGLASRFQLRLMCHQTLLTPEPGEDVVVTDLRDLAAAEAACKGIDCIVHMAGNPHMHASFEDTLHTNIVATYHVYEAAIRQGVRRVVFASTNHVTGVYEERGALVTPDMPVRPDGYYGASKAYGELLGRYYADRYGLAVICLRIGSFLPKPGNVRALGTWISERDMVQLTWRAIEAPVSFGIYYGISGNARRQWDISNARDELGYSPEDNGEDFAAEVLARTP